MTRAVLLAVLLTLVPAEAQAAAPPPLAGTERIARTAADPAGGARWALRTWQAKADPGSGASTLTCAQFGRLRGGQLVRTLGATDRVLTHDDRSVCSARYRGQSFAYTPTVFERLADDPVRPTRLTRTVIGGVARADVDAVDLEVRGRMRRVPLSRDRAWLAVLPGSVRRAQVVIRYRNGRRTASVNFRTGRRRGDREFSPHVPGSTRRPLTVPSPTGGPPLALTRFSVGGDGDGDCVEPGRLIAGEAGQWSAEWGSFLDFPTLVGIGEYAAGDWQPTAPTPQSTNGCFSDYDKPLPAFVARRVEPGLLAVGGILERGTRRLAIRRPDGRAARVAVRDRAFLAGLPSTGAVGEHAVLELTDRRGRHRTFKLPTGDQNVPEDQIEAFEVREGGAVVRVRWTGGFEPFAGVDAVRAGDALRVTVYARHPPYFAPDGTSYVSDAIGLFKCVDVVLPEPLGGARVVDHRGRPHAPRRPVGPPAPERPCSRVPAGFRADLPLSTGPAPAAEPSDLGRPPGTAPG